MLFIINQLSNIDLIIIIQKVGGTNDTPSPTFQKVGGHVPPPAPPSDAHDIKNKIYENFFPNTKFIVNL